MTCPSPSSDDGVLISTQLNSLHLSEISKGGGRIQDSTGAQHQLRQSNESSPETNLEVDACLIKDEVFSETEATESSHSQDDDVTPPESPVIMPPQPKIDSKAQLRAQLDEDDFMVIDEADMEETKLKLQQDMELERQRFTGASNWAPVEERLFELLYMREHLAMMPRHWQYDFQGVPFQDHVFSTTSENPPIIYAHNPSTEFQGTKSMVGLIDLASKVRTLMQTGFEAKAPALINKTLNDFVAWAASDGGYRTLEVVPNLIVEVVKSNADHVSVIKSRMKDLAQLQRDFLRIDREDHGWQGVKSEVLDSGFLMAGSPPRSARYRKLRYVHFRKTRPTGETDDIDGSFRRMDISAVSPEKRASIAAAASQASDGAHQASQKRKRSPEDHTSAPGRRKKARESHSLSPEAANTTLQALRTPPASGRKTSKYSRRPPVIWALFIINTSAFLCTLDSAKEDPEAYISWHAEIAFSQPRQCVWHALTVALTVCLARDELMTRLDDFKVLPEDVESDPDL